MSAPARIQLSRKKDWRKPDGAVVVSRPSVWGNPFKADWSKGGKTRAWAVSAFRGFYHNDPEYRTAVVRSLRGKNLACWCPLPKPGEPDLCHAAVLLEWANK